MDIELYPTWSADRRNKATVIFGTFPKHINQAIKSFLRPNGSPKAVRYWLHQYRLKKNKTKQDKRVIRALEQLEPDSRPLQEHLQGPRPVYLDPYQTTPPTRPVAEVRSLPTRPYPLQLFFQSAQQLLAIVRQARYLSKRKDKAAAIHKKEVAKLRAHREKTMSVPGLLDAKGEPIRWSKTEIKEMEQDAYNVLHTPEKFDKLFTAQRLMQVGESTGLLNKLRNATDVVYALTEYTSLHHFGQKWLGIYNGIKTLIEPRFHEDRLIWLELSPFEHFHWDLFAPKYRPVNKTPEPDTATVLAEIKRKEEEIHQQLMESDPLYRHHWMIANPGN